MEKVIYFNNVRFIRDDKTGYYLSSRAKRRIRLHRYVWEFYNGEIPKGYAIHHKDGDRNNNTIENLELIFKNGHARLHGKERKEKCKSDSEYHDKLKKVMANAREEANKWHGSKEGIEWHRKHAQNSLVNKKLIKYNCSQCKKEFESLNRYSKNSNTFCSNNCKSKYRRDKGFDNIKKECIYCGKEYETNKYSKQMYCSKRCSNIHSPRLPQLRKSKEC